MGIIVPSFNLPVTERECTQRLFNAFRSIVIGDSREYVQNTEQLRVFCNVSKILTTSNHKFGMLINGIPGNGKTTLLRAIQCVIKDLNLADPLLSTESHFALAGLCIVTSTELCRVFLKDDNIFEQYKNQSLLAIDDIGVEPKSIKSYGNLYMPISEIIAYRYQRRLYTILTTNIANKTIRPRYGDRIADRLNDMTYIVTMPDVNFRKL